MLLSIRSRLHLHLHLHLHPHFHFATPKLYLFPGQGTQEKGMLNGVKEQFKDIIDVASHATNLDFLQINTVDCRNLINKPHVAQPLVVLSSYLQAKLAGIHVRKEDYLIGHSIGEYAALLGAGSVELEECLRICKVRGELIEKYTKEESGMLVVIAKTEDLDRIHSLIKENGLEIGCFNTKTQLVVSGTKTKTRLLHKEFRRNQILCTFLPVEAAFHCQALKPMTQQFQSVLDEVSFKVPQGTILRNYDCSPYKAHKDIVEGLTKQLHNSVRFRQSVLQTPSDIEWVEVSHKSILGRFMKEIRKE